MINPESIHVPAKHELERHSVRRLEHIEMLGAHRRQFCHVEESAVVELVRSRLPQHEAIDLRLKQPVECFKALRLSRFPVDLTDIAFDKLPDLGRSEERRVGKEWRSRRWAGE